MYLIYTINKKIKLIKNFIFIYVFKDKVTKENFKEFNSNNKLLSQCFKLQSIIWHIPTQEIKSKTLLQFQS